MAWYSKRNRIIFLAALGLVLVGWQVFSLYVYLPWLEASGQYEIAPDAEPVREITVTAPYELKWQARGRAPALNLTLPLADFGGWRAAQHAAVNETIDGPRYIALDLRLPDAGEFSVAAFPDWCSAALRARNECEFGRGRLTLHRDPGSVEIAARKILADDVNLEKMLRDGEINRLARHWKTAFWVRTDEATGAWSFQGWDCAHAVPVAQAEPAADPVATEPGFFSRKRCFEPPGKIARWLPSWHDLKKANLYVTCPKTDPGNCIATYVHRDRPVVIEFPRDRWAMLFAGMEQLERWARDTAAPPAPEVQLQRASRALANCEAANERYAGMPPDESNRIPRAAALSDKRAMEETAREQCGYAVQLAHRALAGAPVAAAGIMLRTMSSAGYNRTPWDRFYADDALTVLAKAGTRDGPQTVQAHLARLGVKQADDEMARQSVEALLELTPKAVAADDPLFKNVDTALASYLGNREAEKPRLIEFRRSWLAKAELHAGAESDLALQVRFLDCDTRLSFGYEPATLDICADRLMADWEKRAPANPVTEIAGLPLGYFAIRVSWMYASHAQAAQDFAKTLAKIRALLAFAQTHIDMTRDGRPLFEIGDAERNVADRMRGK